MKLKWRNLRAQLIISHVLPVVGVTLLIGLAIIYLFEYRSSDLAEGVTLRYVILGILGIGLVMGVVSGWRLARKLGNPIQKISQAVCQMAEGDLSHEIPEEGPEEINQLASAVNTLIVHTLDLKKERKQLLANLVHELGRPLGALRAATHALQTGADQDPALRHELLTGMDEEIRRLQCLLEDLAHLNDQSLGNLKLQTRAIRIGAWLPKLLSPWRQAAQDKRLHWDLKLDPNLPELCIDPDRLAQAIGNLLSNAIRYTPTGGRITVSVGRQTQFVWIKVGDTGPGIPVEEQERVFTPFYRGNPKSRFPEGMGLGLSIARDLVTAHGGHLDLESSPGLGSQFTIWLPVNPA